MSNHAQQLQAEMAELNRRNQELRSVLLRFEETCSRLAQLVGDGESMSEGLESVRGSLQRRDVNEATEQFDTARHRVRVAMFALALDQGTSRSEMGRALGISRQLASRLAAEIED